MKPTCITAEKPQLLFFQNQYDGRLPEFLLVHKQEHVACLSEFFRVTVIRGDCDFQQMCERYQPDLALFESGVNLLTCRRPRIDNVRSCPNIPKLGLLNADAWCETRSGSLSEMDQWGIEAFFSISATAIAHLGSAAERLFIWPNFVDPDVYRDYGESKIIPILLSGATGAQYPWRKRIYKLVAEYYPCLRCPHRGYLSRTSAGQVLEGITYARTINSSMVAPVCGTIAKEIIRKHFEIPACNTCLITERSRNLEAAGFIDMINCVFADEHDILDKLEFLFKNPSQLASITTAGNRLVHSQHTLRNRDQILQWFNLHKNLGANQRIVQPGLFGPLTVESTASPRPLSPALQIGTHLQLLREGDERLWAGKIDAACGKYRRCMSYMHRLPEARFKLALCKLYKGDAADANADIFSLLQYCVAEYRARDPDPIEWAYYIISLLCMGDLLDAKNCAQEFGWLRHPELDRVRSALRTISASAPPTASPTDKHYVERHSIHQLPTRSEEEWCAELYRLLRVCKQPSLAEMIAGGNHEAHTRRFSFAHEAGSLLPQRALERKFLAYKVRRKLRSIQAKVAYLTQRAGYQSVASGAAPASYPALLIALRDLARDYDIKTVLIVASSVADDAVQALLEGAIGSECKPLICCISEGPPVCADSEGVGSAPGDVQRYRMPTTTARFRAFDEGLEQTLLQLKWDHALETFDLVVLGFPELGESVHVNCSLLQDLLAARLVVLGDLQSAPQRQIYARLLRSADWMLLDSDAAEGSYATLRNIAHGGRRTHSVASGAFSQAH